MDRRRVRWLVLGLTAAVTLPMPAYSWAQTPPAPRPIESPPQAPPPPPDVSAAPDVVPSAPPPQEAPPPPPPPVLQPPQPPEGPVPATVPTTWGPTEPEEAVVGAAARGPIARPRLSAAVGFGGSFDSVGFAGTEAVPEFVGVLGIGDGLLGLNVGGFAQSATRKQRQSDSPVDRVAVDLYGVVRPGALHRRDDRSFELRVLHSLAAEVGLGLERAGRSNISGTRLLIHLGATVDLPLTPANEPTELRFRLGVRRNIGLYTPKLYGATAADVTSVGDTAVEVYGALAFLF
jgi:hypothetical protein